MKSNSSIRHAVFAVFLTCWLSALAARGEEVELSPAETALKGSDTGKSLTAALARLPANKPVRLILHDGVYPLSSTLVLSNEAQFPLTIEAAPGEHPVLSGGIQINDWQPLKRDVFSLPSRVSISIWVAKAPQFNGHTLNFRELWINESKATRARQPNGDAMYRLVAWDKTNQVATIPAAALDGLKKPEGLEMVIDQVWEIAVLRVKSIRYVGTNAQVTFRQPESQIEFQHPWPPVTVKPNYQAPFYLVNAGRFLDSPGEWFEDVSAGKVYYWPRPGEDMTQAKVFAPALETLVKIAGSKDEPAGNIQFKGITFTRTTWLRPSEQGHVPLQAGMYMLAAHKLSPRGTSYHRGLDNVGWIGRPPGAVMVENAAHVSFENCTFEHLAAAGLDIPDGTHDDLVEGCTFRDIGGNGIQLGKFSDTNVETHIPWQPSDPREICTDETIANNLFTDCGTEDWGCLGIAAGYVRGVSIEHNEVCNLPYSGISVGWGWTKTANCMSNNIIHANHIHDVALRLNDTAGIYLLSAQPGTVVSENNIHDIRMSPYVPDPDHWFYLYLDEGSSFITVRDNWCPAEKFLKNANGPGNVWQNNGPQVAEQIKNAAGREPAFQSPVAK